MKGYLTSFTGLFGERRNDAPPVERVEIPLIQRDYAQGRPDDRAQEIRSGFLRYLLDALDGRGAVGLDFVYGKAEKGVFYPLDGQQRLTTLFLLHWYLASASGRLEPDAPWTQFSYATRPSARLFCERLTQKPLPLHEERRPSEWIVDQPWYLYVWRHDPTIQSMLVMIDAMHADVERRRTDGFDPSAAWERLNDVDRPSVSFYLLPLDEMQSDEDLYIKMNSRGKPLTPFENFKARFEDDVAHSDRSDELAHRIDGPWSDLLWPYRGDNDLVDDEFMRYFDYVTEICELRDGEPQKGRIGQRARNVFGADNPRSAEHLTFLFQAFDVWRDLDIDAHFDSIFTLEPPTSPEYDPDKVRLFGASSTNLFALSLNHFDSQLERRRDFSIEIGMVLYAVLLNRIHGTEDFPRRLRILRNLLAASSNEIRRDRMAMLLRVVDSLILDGAVREKRAVSSNQLEDERLKHAFLETAPHLRRSLNRLEDHSILRGTLSAFELDPAAFNRRAEAFMRAFDDPEEWILLTGALLATGDYQQLRRHWDAWRFGSSVPSQERIWREVLTDLARDDVATTGDVLAEFLDGLAESGLGVSDYCQQTMADWLRERGERSHLDWRYYVVKYPAMRSGASGLYFGVDRVLGYSMVMMRKRRLYSHYDDPVVTQLIQSSDVGSRIIMPVFTGPATKPRWLRLLNSNVGIRSVERGYEIQGTEDPTLVDAYAELCARHGVGTQEDGSLLLPVPQRRTDEGWVDTVDRIDIGVAFIRDLVAAGL
ncbi:MAG TPA: DUF262 domain-containing protein [Intrasporangiaceae bacterium]|nr:DUF262 domain-containing protein [Intrasporangiaceae bacterium]